MSLTNTLLFLGPLTILFFFILERLNTTKDQPAYRYYKIASYLLIASAGFAISLYSSQEILVPFARIIVPFEIFSVSSLKMPQWLNMIICFFIIDFFQYWNHRLHHKLSLLWRLHRLHHSDKVVDSLTTLLHHPLEILSTFLVVTALYILFDIAMVVIFYYSILFSIHAAFAHTSLAINPKFDKFLSYLIVTPSIHRLHHALNLKDSNSNFGQILTVWDQLFNTFTLPQAKKKALIFGITKNQSPEKTSFYSFIVNPFKN